MRFFLSLLATAVVALVTGLGSAWYMVAEPRAGTVRVGAWTALPSVDADGADPYTRARIARTGEITMGTGEGLVFIADVDDEGQRLEARCDYRLAGAMPPARLWTLVAQDDKGVVAVGPTGRNRLHSREILRGDGGRFEIVVAASARAGNWLPAPATGPIRLVLRLYDTPTSPTSSDTPDLPQPERRACR